MLHKKIEEVLEGFGRSIDEAGGFDIEITPDRTPEDIRDNRPGTQLRRKILRFRKPRECICIWIRMAT